MEDTNHVPSKMVPFRGSLVDYVKFQVRHTVPLVLSDTDLTLLAYIFLYKDRAQEMFLDDGHSKSDKSVENYISRFRKIGLIVGKLDLHPNLYLSTNPADHIYTFEIHAEDNEAF